MPPGGREQEFKQIRSHGFAFDDEEFLPGLLCLAVGVPAASGRSSLCLAVQAPILRCSREKALSWLEPLRRTAKALTQIEAELPTVGYSRV
mgnify:FL=1